MRVIHLCKTVRTSGLKGLIVILVVKNFQQTLNFFCIVILPCLFQECCGMYLLFHINFEVIIQVSNTSRSHTRRFLVPSGLSIYHAYCFCYSALVAVLYKLTLELPCPIIV